MAEGGGGTIAALSSAQRYPDDYDTIAVTGMSSYLTRHTFGQMWIWQATHKDAASFIPPDKYPRAAQTRRSPHATRSTAQGRHHRRLARCRFDPAVTLCKARPTTGPSCLTGAAGRGREKDLRRPEEPAHRRGDLFAALSGQRARLGTAGRRRRQPLGIPVEFFKSYVFRDPAWDYRTRPINFDSDVDARRTGRRSSR